MDSDLLISAVASLSREATDEMDAPDLLRRLCEAARTAFSVDGAGVMLTEAIGNRFVHATPVPFEPLERLQEVLRSGPCAQAADTQTVVTVSDLDGWQPWPQFLDAAVTLNVQAVLAVPLISRNTCWGVLDLYRHLPGPWTAAEIKAVQVLADVAVSYLIMAHDRDLARSALQQVVQLSRHDVLTELPNRSVLFEQLEEALHAAQRNGTATAVMFVDLDRFKTINDTFGHQAGDSVLQEVAQRLVGAMRGQDTVARLGGDEFVCVCRNFRPSDRLLGDVTSAVARIRANFDEPIILGETKISISASIGVTITLGAATAHEVLADSDQAMYAAKRQGRGSVVIQDHAHLDRLNYTRQLHRDLNDALTNNELLVHYQPITTARPPLTVVAVEALLRWERQDGSILPAAAFIDSAASTGIIIEFGRWLIEQACGQLRTWIDEFHDTAPSVVYLNFSAVELADPQLPAILTSALHRHHLQPHQVGVEIVEENLADPDIAIRLRRLRARGHPLSIDDFGTGYSSLSRLVDLPVDLIKIDRTFIAGIPADTKRVGVINAILNIAEALGIQTVAEGVETQEQQQHLTHAGTDLLQGYYLGRPQPAQAITQQLSAIT